MDYTIINSSMRNRLSLLYKQLVRAHPEYKITPFILQAWGELENGKDPKIMLTRQFNPLEKIDTTQSLIDDNDGVYVAGWKLLVKKVTDTKFASAIPYPFAKSDVFNAAPASVNTELENINGLMRYSGLSLKVSGDSILNGIQTEWFHNVPPVLLAAGSNDATPQGGEAFEEYFPIYETLGFVGSVRNEFSIALGGDNNTIAGDSTASPAEQNYVGLYGIGFKVQDGERAVKGMIDGQNRCQLP